ncbi:MAG: GTP-binding protein YchF [Candidatus Yanofskybacteria bacterium GW2011_GWB1_45_11]|uniref:GTP-binding protein YchF n=1 Tax=Candidatus Yanofskybacteria bacterium GW2011_GWB1_45_11 TaxID=1619026 RepID=A0A0G1L365_9BACT|nr:MAG: GTP-binding protein YchF [Candidatus Yanofskybacteria bacterium GW2011_GWB1_45_11]
MGKSTLFKAITNKQVDIQNYPFTTIEPNVGVVAVPDERVDALAMLSDSARKIYTTIEFFDIAGLVKGASQGEGLGNKFLANIREVDAIAHVVRVFPDNGITHVHNRVDPTDDISIINTELELADLESKEKRADKSNRGKDLPPLNLLSDKKVIYVFNVSEKQLSENWQPDEKLKSAIGSADYIILSTPFELLLSESTQDEKKEYLAEFNIKESGLDALIKKSYHTLGLLTFLTTGEDETRAWTARIGDLIPKAARAIHTDFEKLFIRADVINWKTLLEIGGWIDAKSKGMIKTVGRDYVIQEGDVVEIKI